MESFLMDPFGLHVDSLNTWQMLLRGLVVFITGLILLRMSGLRTLGKGTAFDQLMLLIVGSILGRAVVTGKCFFGALAAVMLITALHRLLSWLTFKSKRLGAIFKGEPLLLIAHGQKQSDNMSKANITDEDIKEELHISLNTDKINHVSEAYLERSGHISFIKPSKEE